MDLGERPELVACHCIQDPGKRNVEQAHLKTGEEGAQGKGWD